MNFFAINLGDYLNDYLEGKKVYPVLSRILNLLFVASITSFIFEKFYFKYTWLDISDYKSILDFLIKGRFFIPFPYFFVLYCAYESLFKMMDFFAKDKVLTRPIKWQVILLSYGNLQRLRRIDRGIRNAGIGEIPEMNSYIQRVKGSKSI